MFMVVCLVLCGASVFAADEPRRIFGLTNDKRIRSFSLLQNDSVITLRYRDRLWGYNSATGEKKWEIKVDDWAGGDIYLTWNDKLYLMPLKKGLAAYDVNTGKQVWKSDFEVKLKEFVNSYSYKDNFLLEFNEVLVSLNPDTGAVAWQTEVPAVSKDTGKLGVQRLHYISQDWGSRILLAGEKGPVLLDAKTGEVMWQSDRRFSGEIKKPVLFASDTQDSTILLYDKGASGLNLKTGEEAWYINDDAEDVEGLVQFENNGGRYCMFAFVNQTVTLDAATGKIMWTADKDSAFKGRPYTITSDSGDLLAVTARNAGPQSSFLTLYRLAADTGAVKWKRDLSNSKMTNWTYKNLAGSKQRQLSMWYKQAVTPQGLLFQVWGADTHKLTNKDEIGEKKGEGLIMVDPASGAVVWRSYLTLMDAVKKDVDKMWGPLYGSGIIKTTRNVFSPDDPLYQEMIPAPIITEDAAYAPGNDSLLKIDLNTGTTIWTSLPYGYLSKIVPSGNELYGVQGTAQWEYYTDLNFMNNFKAHELIVKSRTQGFFCLDAATGKQLWLIDSSKKPYFIFPPIVDKDNAAFYVTDGKYLRRLELKPDTGGFAWELDLEKAKIGEIGIEKGVAFQKIGGSFWVAADLILHGGMYAVSYDHRMVHGVRQLADGDLLAIAGKGAARIWSDGKMKWRLQWEWKTNKTNFYPTLVQSDKYLLYQSNKKLYCVDIETGAIKWATKEAKDAEFKIDKEEKRIFVVDNDEVTAYEI